MTQEFKREIRFLPAYDKRDPNPRKDYGIHCVDMVWYLYGPRGVIQFKVFTNWMLPEIQAELEAKSSVGDTRWLHLQCHPMPADLGYHSTRPLYPEQHQTSEECEVLGGQPCYYDGSTLNAEPVFQTLVREGDEAVWKKLEEYYGEVFNDPPARSAGVKP